MDYKLIALDIDGTILNSKGKISDETINVIDKCIKDKIKVVLASGRYFESIKAFTKSLNINSELITLNGAVIKDSKTGKTLKEFAIPKDDYRNILKKLSEYSFPFYVFTSDDYYRLKGSKYIEKQEKLTGPKAKIINSFEDVENPIKILMIIDDEDEIERVKNVIEDDKYRVIKTGYNNVEVVRRDVSKGRALKIISDYYGINRENTMAIGDSENDVEMIEFAGMGIAMGNAYDNVKKASNEITSTCDENGAQKAIEKYVFNIYEV